MRTNGKIGMLQRFIHQYTIIMFTVTFVIAVNKPTFKCPDPSQWNLRAKRICNDTEKYICLFDENGQRDEEFCGSWPDFENPGYKQILLGGTTRKPCSAYRFQPFTFWTNGSSKCVYQKTFCNQEGQVIYNNGTAQSDRTCRCDYTKNYDFQVKPRNNCFCVPTKEDCSCYVKPCPAGSRLTPDYECLEESRWKLSFFSCSEIKEDSIDDPVEMSTIISTYGYEMLSDSDAWPSVSVTVLCIAAGCVVILAYLLSKNIEYFEKKQSKGRKDDYNRNKAACIPNDVLDLQKKEIEKWRKKHEHFEVTHASKTVLNEVETYQFVILSGPPGSGKSAIAYYTALMLEKNAEYKILPVSSPEEIRKYLLPKTKQIFVIDDPVGKYTVDDSCIQRWKNEETFIKQTFIGRSNTKLILTCRSYIYKSGFSRKLKFSPVHCDLLSHNLKMRVVERANIYHRYDIEDLKEDTIMMYDFFPSLCAIYSKKEDTTMFFVNPYKILTEEMKNTKEKSDIAFLAIALLVVQDNNIDRQTLSLENPTINKLLIDLCNECGFRYFPSTTMLLSALNDLIGTYVLETENGFACIHYKLFLNLSFIVGRGIIHCLLKHGNSTFLANRLQLASIEEDYDELTIMVQPEQEELYFKRLLSDIRKGYHSDVLSGIQMKHLRFRTIMIKYLKRLKAKDLKRNGNSYTPLHVVSEQGYEDLANELIKLNKEHTYYKDKYKRSPLYIACFGGHCKVARTLLVHNKDAIHITNNFDLTPLDAASSNGHYSTVEVLLEYKADVKRKDKNMKRTALYRACENGHYNVVCLLLSHNSDVNSTDSNGLKAIHIACLKGHSNIVELLLKYKGMINERDDNDRTPLFIACEENQQNIVDILIQNKANVNQASKKHTTPLYKACQLGNEYIVGRLLDKSAKVNMQSDDDSSPLYIACFKGELGIVDILLDKKADVNIATKQGRTPFFISCSEDHLEICKSLQHSGANINTADKFELTPLHVACREKHERIVRFLLEHNANVNAINSKKESPLYMSCMNESSEIVELLLKKDADVKICEEKGNSPLHAACLKGNKQIVQLLLDKKANIHQRNKVGKTPFEVVQEEERDNILEMLNHDKYI